MLRRIYYISVFAVFLIPVVTFYFPDSCQASVGGNHDHPGIPVDTVNIRSDSLSRKFSGVVFRSPFERVHYGLHRVRVPGDTVIVTRDSTGRFVARHFISGIPVSPPVTYRKDTYSNGRLKQDIRENWRELSRQYSQKQAERQGLLNFKIAIPGGQNSAFTTIFGRPEVNLQVTGTANLNAGLAFQHTSDPSVPPDQQSTTDPIFNQNLKLNIHGDIGDKLHLNTDWDTERPFDYQNRLHINYTGYEDDILQSVELGNVSMDTGNPLIRGGSALFGIKSVAKTGPLKLTAVLSEQQGQNNTQTITGGATEQQIAIRPADYENNRHFYIGFYAWGHFEQAVANPQHIISLFNISNIRVYKLNVGNEDATDAQPAVAITELGVRKDSSEYLPPDQALDSLDDAVLQKVRNARIDTLDVTALASRLGIKDSGDIVKGTWNELQEGEDYTINRALGIISLKTPLISNEALAIAFDYTENGKRHTVGDIQSLGQAVRILKLIRQPNMTGASRTWQLTLRNVYALGPTNLTQSGMNVNLYYTGQTTQTPTLPFFNSTLLTDLGLDRINTDGQLKPDNQIDFIPPIMNAIEGKILFPYRQPFGQRIIDLIQNNSSIADKQNAIQNLAFPNLYDEPQEIAQQESKNNNYVLSGSVKGGASDTYNLGIALVEGSVHVYANGVELTEGIDYTVDYSLGTVVITNKQYLASGQKIRIDYESNQLLKIQQTTFTGVRAEYNLTPNLSMGGTYFHLNDKPLTDKIRIGDEPINNTILGLDAHGDFKLPWLTRLIDRIPLLHTKSPSRLSFDMEWAQLNPGVAQTSAVSNAIKHGQLTPDERNGLSYIDDFEGTKVSFSFLNPGMWHLAAAPAAIPGYDADMNNPGPTLQDKVNRSDLRAQFSWYMLPIDVSSILGIKRDRVTDVVKVTDVFPNRQTLPQENTIQPLDIYYDPNTRGPYNYNPDLKNITQNEPKRMWGGMTTALPDGLENLTLNNIEYVEFWVQPILPARYRDQGSPTVQLDSAYAGKMFIDVGTVSEDVIPNYTSNNEDALSQLGSSGLVIDQTGRSYVLNALGTYDGQFSSKSQKLEDVGLDGVPDKGGYDNTKNEQVLFTSFISKMKQEYGANSPIYKQIVADPSNDDYAYFGDPKLRAKYGTSSIQPYFYRMYGYYDGNSPLPTADIRGVTNRPDAEGLKTPSVPNYRDSYYEYEVNLNPADPSSMKVGNNFVVDRVPDHSHPGDYWYQVRIPLSDFKRAIGNIKDLQSVTHIRIWLTGYSHPFTLRLATLELVGSQWRKADKVGSQANTATNFNVSTVNIEENYTRTPVPYRQPPGSIRSTNRTQQGNILANEQSLSLEVHDLRQGDIRMVRRDYPGGLNLLHYSHLRMFVHGEGYHSRKDMQLVVRMGRDLNNDYYEYRQPVTPTDTTLFEKISGQVSGAKLDQQAQEVWLPDQNSMNLVLSVLNRLKQMRNQRNADPGQLFEDSTMAEQQGAPPGAVVGIIGDPSLDQITEIGIGIYNPETSQGGSQPSLDATMWVNELSVSGFDNKTGWAAQSNVQMKLADFARLNLGLNKSTDGFGSLDSRLGQRQYANIEAYNLNSTVNLQKLLPERYGWYFPVTLTAQKNISTPRYLPTEGDITLNDYRNTIKAESIPDYEKQALIRQKIDESQTYTEDYSINMSEISKKGSSSPFLHYTLDQTKLNYVYNQGKSHDPTTAFQNYWNYNAGIHYDLTLNKIRLFRPFSFLRNVPVLGLLSGIKLGEMPSSIHAYTTLDRRYEEDMQRAFDNRSATFRQTHDFNLKTLFGLTYNLTPSIPLGFRSRTNYSLSNIGIEPIPGDSTRYRVRPTFDVFRNIITVDSVKPRRTYYDENYTLSWRPQLDRLHAVSWIDYSTSYAGGFTWQNSPLGSGLGAGISNRLDISQNLNLDIHNLLQRWPYFREGEAEDGKPTFGQKLLGVLFSLQSVQIGYDHNLGADQNGYPGASGLFQMFNNPLGSHFSPPLGYRLGLTRELEQWITNPDRQESLSLLAQQTADNNITLKLHFNPFRDFTIDLSWQTAWSSNMASNFVLPPGSDRRTNNILTQSGNITSSVWLFGKGFSELYNRQIRTAILDQNPVYPNLISDQTGNRDGQTVLTPASVERDFRKSYVFGGGVTGKLGFTPIPQPGWSVQWTGLQRFLPFFNAYASQVTLMHQYSGTYRVGWDYYDDAGSLVTGNLGDYTINSYRNAFEASAINLEKNFSPLIGVNISWLNNLNTDIQYDYSKLTSLSFVGPTITDRISKGFKLMVGYSKRGFRLPFLTDRLKNMLNINITAGYLEDVVVPNKLGLDVQRSLNGQPLLDPANDTRGDARLKLTALVGYQFSEMIKANLAYTYQHLMPKSSSSFERTDQNIKLNIIVAIRSR